MGSEESEVGVPDWACNDGGRSALMVLRSRPERERIREPMLVLVLESASASEARWNWWWPWWAESCEVRGSDLSGRRRCNGRLEPVRIDEPGLTAAQLDGTDSAALPEWLPEA